MQKRRQFKVKTLLVAALGGLIALGLALGAMGATFQGGGHSAIARGWGIDPNGGWQAQGSGIDPNGLARDGLERLAQGPAIDPNGATPVAGVRIDPNGEV